MAAAIGGWTSTVMTGPRVPAVRLHRKKPACSAGGDESETAGNEHIEVSGQTNLGHRYPDESVASGTAAADERAAMDFAPASRWDISHAAQIAGKCNKAVISSDNELADALLGQSGDGARELLHHGIEALQVSTDLAGLPGFVDLLRPDQHERCAANLLTKLTFAKTEDIVQAKIHYLAVGRAKERYPVLHAGDFQRTDPTTRRSSSVRSSRKLSPAPGQRFAMPTRVIDGNRQPQVGRRHAGSRIAAAARRRGHGPVRNEGRPP